jgi:1-aminocyclopropane-1-carboxylate deaminase
MHCRRNFHKIQSTPLPSRHTVTPAMANRLEHLITPRIEISLGRHSRVHQLAGYLPRYEESPVYVKREDELGSGIIGSKQRKYLSLLPTIERDGIEEAVLIGSAHSNHVVSLTQLLLQRGVKVTAFVKRPGSGTLAGNLLFLHLLLDHAAIRFVESADWPAVTRLAEDYARSRPDRRILVIPEGGDCHQVLPGILTLAEDILRNERELGIRFPDIWTDSGTGVSSIGLLIGMSLAGESQRTVHITLIAGSETEFLARLRRYQRWTEKLLGITLPGEMPAIRFLQPATAPSFGSVNRTLLEETRHIARCTGILLDPVYSTKHFFTVKKQLQRETPAGPQLLLYNGGALALCGFQHPLANLLQAAPGTRE